MSNDGRAGMSIKSWPAQCMSSDAGYSEETSVGSVIPPKIDGVSGDDQLGGGDGSEYSSLPSKYSPGYCW